MSDNAENPTNPIGKSNGKSAGVRTDDDDDGQTPMEVLRNILAVCRNIDSTTSKILAAMQPPKPGEKGADRLKELDELLRSIVSGFDGLPDELEARVKTKLPKPVAEEIWRRVQEPEAGGAG